MKRIVLTVLLVAVALTLSSCGLIIGALLPGCNPVTISFDSTDPDRIVRGVWTGNVSDYPNEGDESPLVLDLAATYVDAETYAVSGAFVLNSQAPMSFEGVVDGACAERYVQSGSAAIEPAQAEPASDIEAQTSPPRTFLDAEVRDDAGDLVWIVEGSWYSVDPDVRLRLTDPESDASDPTVYTVYVSRGDVP